MTYNINIYGKTTADYQPGDQLDEGFGNIGDLYKHLATSYGGKGKYITERALDNLYLSVTGEKSEFDFSNDYGKKSGIVNSREDLETFLNFLEDLDTKDVFSLVTTSKEKQAQTGTTPVTVESPVPQDIVERFKLDQYDGYYQKYVSANGLPILSSANVLDEDLIKKAEQINLSLVNHPDILAEFIRRKHRIVITGEGDLASDVPEGVSTKPHLFTSVIALVPPHVGSITTSPVTTDYFPNQLGSFDILLHEFSHGVAHSLRNLYPADANGQGGFLNELMDTFNTVTQKGQFQGAYAGSNHGEFWASIAQLYHSSGNPGDAIVAKDKTIRTRDELEAYSPESFALITKYWG